MPKFLDDIQFWTKGYEEHSVIIEEHEQQVVLDNEWNKEVIDLTIPEKTIVYPAENPKLEKITKLKDDVIEEKDKGLYQITELSSVGLKSLNNLTQKGLNALNSKTQGGLDSLENKTQDGLTQITNLKNEANQLIETGKSEITNLTTSGSEQLQDLTDSGLTELQDKITDGLNQITELNITNGPGAGSIETKDFSYVSDGDTYYSTSEASGKNAVCFGENSVASGSNSFIAGISCTATNKRSVAMQNGNHSPGHTTFTIGQLNKNWANGSFMFGNGNIGGIPVYEDDGVTPKAASDPTSQYSIIGGKANKHRGQHSFTMGDSNTVEMNSSSSVNSTITFGIKNTVTDSIGSAIFGQLNVVDGKDLKDTACYNIVAGSGNYVRSKHSAVFGLRNKINHISDYGRSLIAGVDNETTAATTILLGRGLKVTQGAQVAIGEYNKYDAINPNSQAIAPGGTNPNISVRFAVGNGTSKIRSNAFEVYSAGGFTSYGDSYISGKLSVGGKLFTTGEIIASGDVYAILPEDHKYANSLFNVSLISVFDELDEYIINTDQRISTEEITRGEQINLLYGEIGSINTRINNSNAATLSHINNKENPHEVTKSQVGLGSVLNYGQTNAYKDKQNSTLYFNAGGAYNLYTELKKYIDDQIASAITTALNTPV